MITTLMLQITKKINFRTTGNNLYEITDIITKWIDECHLFKGLLNISIEHTSASLLIQENADPTVLKDLKRFFLKLVPFNNDYFHSTEGIDDMPAHIKSSLTNTNLTLSILDNKLNIGKWQGVFLFEHRISNHDRYITLHFIGEIG